MDIKDLPIYTEKVSLPLSLEDLKLKCQGFFAVDSCGVADASIPLVFLSLFYKIEELEKKLNELTLRSEE